MTSGGRSQKGTEQKPQQQQLLGVEPPTAAATASAAVATKKGGEANSGSGRTERTTTGVVPPWRKRPDPKDPKTVVGESRRGGDTVRPARPAVEGTPRVMADAPKAVAGENRRGFGDAVRPAKPAAVGSGRVEGRDERDPRAPKAVTGESRRDGNIVRLAKPAAAGGRVKERDRRVPKTVVGEGRRGGDTVRPAKPAVGSDGVEGREEKNPQAPKTVFDEGRRGVNPVLPAKPTVANGSKVEDRKLRHPLPPRPAIPVRATPYHRAQRSVKITWSGGYEDFRAFVESFGPVKNCWVRFGMGRVDFYQAEDARRCALSGVGGWRTGNVEIENGASSGRYGMAQVRGGVAKNPQAPKTVVGESRRGVGDTVLPAKPAVGQGSRVGEKDPDVLETVVGEGRRDGDSVRPTKPAVSGAPGAKGGALKAVADEGGRVAEDTVGPAKSAAVGGASKAEEKDPKAPTTAAGEGRHGAGDSVRPAKPPVGGGPRVKAQVSEKTRPDPKGLGAVAGEGRRDGDIVRHAKTEAASDGPKAKGSATGGTSGGGTLRANDDQTRDSMPSDPATGTLPGHPAPERAVPRFMAPTAASLAKAREKVVVDGKAAPPPRDPVLAKPGLSLSKSRRGADDADLGEDDSCVKKATTGQHPPWAHASRTSRNAAGSQDTHKRVEKAAPALTSPKKRKADMDADETRAVKRALTSPAKLSVDHRFDERVKKLQPTSTSSGEPPLPPAPPKKRRAEPGPDYDPRPAKKEKAVHGPPPPPRAASSKQVERLARPTARRQSPPPIRRVRSPADPEAAFKRKPLGRIRTHIPPGWCWTHEMGEWLQKHILRFWVCASATGEIEWKRVHSEFGKRFGAYPGEDVLQAAYVDGWGQVLRRPTPWEPVGKGKERAVD